MSASFLRAGLVVKRGSRAVARWLTHSSWPLARKIVAVVLVETLAISTVATTATGARLPVHDEFAGIFALQKFASRLAQNLESPQAQSSNNSSQTPQMKLASLVKPKNIRRIPHPVRPLLQVSNAGLAVSVGFADSSSPTANFPVPWQGPSNIVFLGGGTTFRAGAMRLDNASGSDIVVDKVTVNLGRPGPTFQLWSNFTVPANGSAILTQTADNNFNTSAASPIVTCGQPLAQGETRVPTITVTMGGTDFPFSDTAHVLDTGGFDSSCRGNQSLAWRPIGTTGLERASATLHLASENAPHDVGTSTTFTATLTDAADQPLANAPVGLNVLNGPNTGKSASGTTDTFGGANIQYSSTSQGVDFAQALITNASTGTLKSEQASTTWTSADSCSVPAPAASASRLIYVGQTSGSFGDQLRVAALLTDGTGQPLAGRSLALTVGGNSLTATTDANGVGSTTVTPGIGQTAVSISFAGDSNFSAAQVSSTITIQPKATLLRYTGNSLLGSAGAQGVSAMLTDALGKTPIANRTVTFSVGSTQATATTDAIGNASTTLTFPANQAVGPAQLTVSFAGDADYKSSSRVVPIEIYLTTSFVIWGGNSGGLKVGTDVNFWGAQWAKQVTSGNFSANNSFKGFASPISSIQQCQPNATTATLTQGCWDGSPGNSGTPPLSLPSFIEVIVSTAITKQGSAIFGNTACGAVLKVDANPAYGPDPGHPGFGVITAVNGDCAGVFPKPAVLTAKQTQVTPVLPQQQVPISASISNSGATNASNATLNETFDGLIPATATQSFTTISAGQSVSASFQTSVPAIPARQSGEGSSDYETRLGSLDGRLFTASGELNFTDIFQQLYQPLDFSSFSTLQIPRLSVGVTGPACIVPGSQVPYQVTISNIGSATATQGLATVTLPDGTTQNVTVPKILPSAAFAGSVQWKAPVIKAKDPTETTSAYLARLTAADNVTVPATTASVNWQDAQSNQYGAVDGQVSSVKERLPIISLTPAAPATVLPNQAASANFAVTNTGGGNAIQANILIKQQGQSDIAVSAFSLPAGQSATPTGILRLPGIPLEGPQETDAQYLSRLQALDNQKLLLDANLSWTDKAGNLYGPTSNPFSTTEVLPILTVAATGPATGKPGDNITYTITLQNIGHADAAGLNITFTLPDGSVQHPLAASGLVAGGTAQTSVAFTVPNAQASGPATAKLRLGWTDNAGNSYGLESATVTTTIAAQTVAISDFTPKLGPTGTAVSIQGTNLSVLGGPTTVFFAGPNNTQLSARINFSSATQLAVVVPDGAVTGNIQVTNPTGTANSAVPFTVGPRQDFSVTVSPGTGTVPQSSTTSFVVALASSQTSFTQMATLSVTGLPQGIATAFTPAQITAGASSTLALDLGAVDLQPGNYSFTVHAKTTIDGKPQDRTATATLNVIKAGQTTLAGQVVSTSNEPVVGATVSLDGQSVLTDSSGRFLLVSVQAGTNRPLSVDGHSAFSPNATFPLIFEPANVIAGRANVIPNPFHLPPIDTSQEVTIDPTRDTVAGNAAIPGLQMTVPQGAHLRMLDGTLVTRTSITPLAPDRTPAPLPSDVGTNIVYTSQPGGAITDIPIPVIYPNLAGLDPGRRVELYAFDHAHVNWFVYGFGRVSKDGRTIAPEINPSTGKPYGLPDFSWHFPNTGPNGNPSDPCQNPGPLCQTNNPVDLATGMKIERVPQVSWGGARGGIDFSLVYTTDKAATCLDGQSCPFGVGLTHNWDIRISGSFTPGGAGRLIMPEELTGRLYSSSGLDASGGARFASTATTAGLGATFTVRTSAPIEYRQADGTLFHFNSSGRLIEKIDRNGNTTTLVYNNGNLSQITDPVGRSLTFTYDGGNHVTSITDPLGRVWHYSYGGVFGQLLSITDPAENVTTFTYTGARLASITDPKGNIVKQITYNSSGRVDSQTFADGGTETYSYTLSGTIVTSTTITDPLGNTRSMRFSAGGYASGATDERGQTHGYTRDLTTNLLTSTVGPCGCTEKIYQYDTSGNLLSETDRLGNSLSYQYDPTFNQITEKVDKLGNKTTYRYDSHGNLLTTTDVLNQTSTFSYDSFGQRTSITDSLGHVTQVRYDANGNIVEMVNALGNSNTFQYDSLGRQMSSADPLGRQATFQYDILGRLTVKTDASGAITEYTYDPNGNLTTITDPLGNRTKAAYDRKNRLIATSDPLGNTTQYQYDTKDELTATVSPLGRIYARTYDARGSLTTTIDPSTGVVTYSYDNNKNLATIADQRGNTTRFTYDALNRRIAAQDPDGNSLTISYDANNNMVQKVDRLGRLTTITYDALNRPRTISFPDASVTYSYDAAGRMTQLNDSESGILQWTYDNANQLLSDIQTAGAVQYTYNAAGERASLTVSNRPVVNYTYDTAGRLSTITQGNEIFTYTYDALSRIASLQRPNGIPTSYAYDAANRLIQLAHGTNGVIENLGYSYTADSQVATISSLAAASLVPPSTTLGPADPANRITQVGEDILHFDAEGQIASDANAKGTSQYLFDTRGRLTQVTMGNGQTVNYQYDGLGRRIGRSANGVTTQFLYDNQDVVEDISGDGNTVNYLNGPGLDQKLRQLNSTTGDLLYFLQDRLGSTIALTDVMGIVVEREQYDAYGGSPGSNLTRYLYTGRESDVTTGLIYYRARYYNPATGRFLNEDPMGFSGSGVNFYEYAANSPLNFIDPFGYSFWSCFGSGLLNGIITTAIVVVATTAIVAIAPVAAPIITGALLIGGAIGFASTAVSIIEDPSANNIGYNLGSITGSLLVGGASGRLVAGRLSPPGYQPPPEAPPLVQSTLQNAWKNPDTGNISFTQFIKDFPTAMGTGPDTAGAAGALTGAGSGLANVVKCDKCK
jgi:RHS repeat-associated protein/uncharacterized repeat protein (TIGR01451 family)